MATQYTNLKIDPDSFFYKICDSNAINPYMVNSQGLIPASFDEYIKELENTAINKAFNGEVLHTLNGMPYLVFPLNFQDPKESFMGVTLNEEGQKIIRNIFKLPKLSDANVNKIIGKQGKDLCKFLWNDHYFHTKKHFENMCKAYGLSGCSSKNKTELCRYILAYLKTGLFDIEFPFLEAHQKSHIFDQFVSKLYEDQKPVSYSVTPDNELIPEF